MICGLLAVHLDPTKMIDENDTLSDDKNMIQENVAVNSLCQDLKCIESMDIGLTIMTNGNLAPILVVPQNCICPLNGTKESTTNWYDFYLLNSASHFRNVPLKQEFSNFPSRWPFEQYTADLLIVFKSQIPSQNFTNSLHPAFSGSLEEQDLWSPPNETSTFGSQEAIKDYSQLYFPSASFTVIQHRIILSHSQDFIRNNFMYWIIAFVPAAILSGQCLVTGHISRKKIREITYFVIGLNLTILGILLQYTPSYTIIQIVVISSLVISIIILLKNLTDKNKKESESETKDSPIYFREDPFDRKAHLETLNEIYKKLGTIFASENDDHAVELKVFKDYDEYQRSNFLSLSIGAPATTLEEISVQDLGKDLHRAITHLGQHQEYSDIVELWKEIQKLVEEYNKNMPNFMSFLENHIHTVIIQKTQFKEFHKEDSERGYHLDNIKKVLLYGLYIYKSQPESFKGFPHIQLKKIANVHAWYEDYDGGFSLIQVKQGDEVPDIEQIKEILVSIIKDKNVLSKYQSQHELYVKIIQECKNFSKKMKPLINDIEKNGFVIEGKCDLGY
jgi:hypothetical protein